MEKYTREKAKNQLNKISAISFILFVIVFVVGFNIAIWAGSPNYVIGIKIMATSLFIFILTLLVAGVVEDAIDRTFY